MILISIVSRRSPSPITQGTSTHSLAHCLNTNVTAFNIYRAIWRGGIKNVHNNIYACKICAMLLSIHTLFIQLEECKEGHNLYARKYVYFKKSPCVHLSLYKKIMEPNHDRWLLILRCRKLQLSSLVLLHLRQNSNHSPEGKVFCRGNFFCLSMFIQTGTAGSRVTVGCGRVILLCIKWFRAKFEPACHTSVL